MNDSPLGTPVPPESHGSKNQAGGGIFVNNNMRRNKKHPTLFVLDGSTLIYEDGSMLDLHAKITPSEWESIVEDTIKYKIFVECLKKVAIPILKETWDEDEEWFLNELEVAVSRIRNIDPLLVAKHDQQAITESYSEQMRTNADEMNKLIIKTREEYKDFITKVSDL